MCDAIDPRQRQRQPLWQGQPQRQRQWPSPLWRARQGRVFAAAGAAAVICWAALALEAAADPVVEEGALERVGRSLHPYIASGTAPLVAALIVYSRDDAVAHGVEPIPEWIRDAIEDEVPGSVLDRVRWCADCGSEFSLQKQAFRLELVPAITLDHVVVFADREAALTDPALWLHELRHVMQFEEWGVADFARRYVEDYEAVEREAYDFRWEWVERTDWLARRDAIRARMRQRAVAAGAL